MNLAVQVRFVRRVLGHLDRPDPAAAAVAHYSWLRDYRAAVTGWLAEHELVRQTIRHLRLHGLHAGTQVALNHLWKDLAIRGRDGLRALAGSWCGYVRPYRPRDPAARFVASTEVLESSFGKLKRVSRQQSDSGLTGLALTLGTMVGRPSDAEIVAGLEATPQKMVDGWIQSSLGQSVQWLRRRLLDATPR